MKLTIVRRFYMSKYKIITENNTDALAMEVNHAIKRGAVLVGGVAIAVLKVADRNTPYHLSSSSDAVEYSQAVIYKDKED